MNETCTNVTTQTQLKYLAERIEVLTDNLDKLGSMLEPVLVPDFPMLTEPAPCGAEVGSAVRNIVENMVDKIQSQIDKVGKLQRRIDL